MAKCLGGWHVAWIHKPPATLVHQLRARIDNLVLRTTFITGFPGETDEQFEELVDLFVKLSLND